MLALLAALCGLQIAVVCELWLLWALLHIYLYLERIAGQVVNLAKVTCRGGGSPNP